MKRPQFSIIMDEERRAILDEAAQRKCMSRSEYIRWLVDKGLDQAYDAGFCDGLENSLGYAPQSHAELLTHRKELDHYGRRKSTYA